jgi:thioredoxin-related protein
MKLKYLFLVLAFGLAQPAFAQKSASSIIKNAKKQAAVQNKKIFIIFHASWCGWCKRMDKEMHTPSTKGFFDNHFVIKHITVLERKENKDRENPGGEKFMAKYHGKKAGLPYWLILDKNGKLLADSFDASKSNLGCPATKKEVAAFIHKLKKTTDITKKQKQAVTEAFVLKK